MLKDVVYDVQPIDSHESSLTSPHYVIIADRLRAPNASCGINAVHNACPIHFAVMCEA